MKNYKDSDYALNRYSEGIVYRFADQIVEITLADYLAQNPSKTEQDFRELKELSDTIYLEQDRADNAQTRKNDSIHWMEDSLDTGAPSLEEQYIEFLDKQYALSGFRELLASGSLTETQERRLLLYIAGGLSTRRIAVREGATQRAIVKSLHAAIEKLKKYLSI